jgi:hypothetical protein
MTKAQVINTLSSDAFWQVNKALGRAVGIELAVFVTEILSKYRYWQARGMLDSDGGFFWTGEDIEQMLGVSERTRKRLTRQIQEAGLVLVLRRGHPGKNRWYIQWEKLAEILETGSPSGDAFGKNLAEIEPSEAGTVPTAGAETAPTYTNKTIPKKQVKARKAAFAQVADVFSAGYEALNGAKLVWVGNEKKYGSAMKRLLEQAKAVRGKGATDAELLDEIKGRGRALILAISEARAKFRKGERGADYLANKNFFPTTLSAMWNDYLPKAAEPEAAPKRVLDIDDDELKKHREAGGV